MSVSIKELRGMTDSIADCFKSKGISMSDQLLEACRTPAQRKALASEVGCATRDILELANRADLNRVKGIGGAYSDLIEQAGVDTVKELAQRRADNLQAKIVEINNDKALTKQPPALSMVEDWVAQAKSMARAIEY